MYGWEYEIVDRWMQVENTILITHKFFSDYKLENIKLYYYLYNTHIHTHTYTHIYIYIYIN